MFILRKDWCGSGFMFVIQSVSPTSLAKHGADLGYGNLYHWPEDQPYPDWDYTPIFNSIAIEFDFTKTVYFNEPDGKFSLLSIKRAEQMTW